MTSGTVSSFLLLLLSSTPALAAIQQSQFNQVINVAGDMTLQSFQFPDGSRIETYSQSQQQIIVNQQQPSIPANQVTGTTGSPFIQVSPASMQISTNNAINFVGGQIEMGMSMDLLQQAQVQMDNTYVAMLSPDRQSWMIQETLRSNNATDMTVRMVKRETLDGEYMIIGRQTSAVNTLVTPFGTDPGSTVNILGTGIQENEFQDGFRLSVRANQPMTMNVKVNKGVDTGMLTALQGQVQVNDFRYQVTTNLGAVLPSLDSQVTVLQMPIPAIRIQKMMQSAGVASNGMVALSVAQRPVLQNPGGATGQLASPFGSTTSTTSGTSTTANTPLLGRRAAFRELVQKRQGTPTQQTNPVATNLLLAPTFTPVQAAATLDTVNMRIAVPLPQTDGEYILTMTMMSAQGQAIPMAQPAGSLTPATNPQTAPAGATQPQVAPAGTTQPQGTTQPAGTTQPQGTTQPAGTTQPLTSTTGSNSTTPATTRMRRQMAPQVDQYGMPIAPLGSVIMTMGQLNQMASLVTWGGSVPITEIMAQFQRGQTGGAALNGTATPALQISV